MDTSPRSLILISGWFKNYFAYFYHQIMPWTISVPLLWEIDINLFKSNHIRELIPETSESIQKTHKNSPFLELLLVPNLY